MRVLWPLVLGVALGACRTSDDEEGDPPDGADGVTWYGDVEPMVAMHCGRCHREGGLGVGDFTDATVAADFASLMLSAVDAGRMPPPASDPSCRDYEGSDAMTLGAEERDLLAAWVDAGAPLGDPADAVTLAPVDDALSEPDLELRIPAPYTPVYADPENEDNEYRCFVLDPGHDEDFFLTAMAPIVDQRSVLHHAVLLVKDRADLRPEELEPEGVNCMGGAGTEANGQTVVAWAPGMLPVELPPGTGVRVGAEQVLMLQIHYFQSPGSEGVADQSGYAFRTAPAVETLAVTRQAGLADFLIPAGEPAYESSGVYTPRFDEDVLGVFPHMHTLGDRFHASVQHGDGSETCLVDGRYDFDNQLTYAFLDAVPLGPDDRMTYTCTWNNSRSNPEVVGDPVDTAFGERTDEEMCIFFTLVREVGEATQPLAAEPVDPRALAAGAVQVNFASDAAGTFIEDRCVGEVVVSGEPPDVQASGACALQGPLAAFFGAGPHSVDIVGGPEGGQFVLDLAGNPFESDWTADVEGPAVYGAFDGIAPIVSDLGTADVWFAGGFHVDATP